MQDLNEIRLKIATSTHVLNLFLNMLSIGSQRRVEQYMDLQELELRDVKTSVNYIAAMLPAKAPGEVSRIRMMTNFSGRSFGGSWSKKGFQAR